MTLTRYRPVPRWHPDDAPEAVGLNTGRTNGRFSAGGIEEPKCVIEQEHPCHVSGKSGTK